MTHEATSVDHGEQTVCGVPVGAGESGIFSLERTDEMETGVGAAQGRCERKQDTGAVGFPK